MAKWIVAPVLFMIGVWLLMTGTVIPLIKNRKCTFKVTCFVDRKKDKSISADTADYNYTNYKAHYYYRNRSYKARLSIGNSHYKDYVPLRIDPAKPGRYILDSRNTLIATVIITSLTAAAFIALAVFWVLAVIYSVLV